jgi:hypothetical protein
MSARPSVLEYVDCQPGRKAGLANRSMIGHSAQRLEGDLVEKGLNC